MVSLTTERCPEESLRLAGFQGRPDHQDQQGAGGGRSGDLLQQGRLQLEPDDGRTSNLQLLRVWARRSLAIGVEGSVSALP